MDPLRVAISDTLAAVGFSAASGRPVRVLLIPTQGRHADGFSSAFLVIEDVRHPVGPTTCRDREAGAFRDAAVAG
jgi:hypothetical protein